MLNIMQIHNIMYTYVFCLLEPKETLVRARVFMVFPKYMSNFWQHIHVDHWGSLCQVTSAHEIFPYEMKEKIVLAHTFIFFYE